MNTEVLAGSRAIKILGLGWLTDVLIQVAQLRWGNSWCHFVLVSFTCFWALRDSALSPALSRVLAHSTQQKHLLLGPVQGLQGRSSLPGPDLQLWVLRSLPFSRGLETLLSRELKLKREWSAFLWFCVKLLHFRAWGNMAPRRLGLESTAIYNSLPETNTWFLYLPTASSLRASLNSWVGNLAGASEARSSPDSVLGPGSGCLLPRRHLVSAQYPALSPLSDHRWLFRVGLSDVKIQRESDLLYLALCFITMIIIVVIIFLLPILYALLEHGTWVAFNKSMQRPKAAELSWGLWGAMAMTDGTNSCSLEIVRCFSDSDDSTDFFCPEVGTVHPERAVGPFLIIRAT